MPFTEEGDELLPGLGRLRPVGGVGHESVGGGHVVRVLRTAPADVPSMAIRRASSTPNSVPSMKFEKYASKKASHSHLAVGGTTDAVSVADRGAP